MAPDELAEPLLPAATTERRATTAGVALNIFMIVCYPFGVPYCFGGMGWAAGGVVLAVSAAINVAAGVCVGDVCARLPHLTTYPGLVAEAFGEGAGSATRALQYAAGADGIRCR